MLSWLSQEQQYFSHPHFCSGISHCAHSTFVLVLIFEPYREQRLLESAVGNRVPVRL
jgi:hypothetical protein